MAGVARFFDLYGVGSTEASTECDSQDSSQGTVSEPDSEMERMLMCEPEECVVRDGATPIVQLRDLQRHRGAQRRGQSQIVRRLGQPPELDSSAGQAGVPCRRRCWEEEDAASMLRSHSVLPDHRADSSSPSGQTSGTSGGARAGRHLGARLSKWAPKFPRIALGRRKVYPLPPDDTVCTDL